MTHLLRISAVIVCVAAMVMLGCGNASGANVNNLYQCQTIVTGQGEEARGFGFPGQGLRRPATDRRPEGRDAGRAGRHFRDRFCFSRPPGGHPRA